MNWRVIYRLGKIPAVIVAVIGCYTWWESRAKPDLQYKVECYNLMQGDELIKIPNKDYLFSLERQFIGSPFSQFSTKEDINNLSFCKLYLINTGKKELEYADLYSSTPFSLNFKTFYRPMGMFLDKNNTPQYINLAIKSISENKVIINFDTIKAGDFAVIGILFNHELEHNMFDIVATSKYFDKIMPLDYKSAELLGTQDEKNNLKPLDISDIILLTCLLLVGIYWIYIVFSIYKQNHTIEKKEKKKEK